VDVPKPTIAVTVPKPVPLVEVPRPVTQPLVNVPNPTVPAVNTPKPVLAQPNVQEAIPPKTVGPVTLPTIVSGTPK
jgi:hypothetical protein